MGRTYNSNMKFLVLFACVAAASANLVTYPNGAVAPAKTPEVQAAEAAHFAAKGAHAYAYAPGFYGYNGLYNGYYNGYYPTGVYGAYHHGGLIAYANGAVAPVDTPEVQAAKAAHFAAHGIAAPVAPIAPVAYAAGYPYGVAGLVAHPNGAVVPAEPADVVAARAEHLAAHAAA